MIDTRLEDLELYQILRQRTDRVAAVLQGLIVAVAGDASEFLQFIRNRFPHFTAHDLQHSWRIVSRIETILTAEAKADLSSVELFAFIVAAALHDVGMAHKEFSLDQVRRTHHILSEDFLFEYMTERLSIISEYVPRLSKCIGFAMRAHGMDWDAMVETEIFRNHERILGQQLRTSVLAVLLRLGDLLDLDSDRTCDALQRHLPTFFDDSLSQIHHARHKHVMHFNYDSRALSITVEAHTKEEHAIWTEWLAYKMS